MDDSHLINITKLAQTNTQVGVTFLNWHLKKYQGDVVTTFTDQARLLGERRGKSCDLVDVFFSSTEKYKRRISSAFT
jgi:hypothetical protein